MSSLRLFSLADMLECKTCDGLSIFVPLAYQKCTKEDIKPRPLYWYYKIGLCCISQDDAVPAPGGLQTGKTEMKTGLTVAALSLQEALHEKKVPGAELLDYFPSYCEPT